MNNGVDWCGSLGVEYHRWDFTLGLYCLFRSVLAAESSAFGFCVAFMFGFASVSIIVTVMRHNLAGISTRQWNAVKMGMTLAGQSERSQWSEAHWTRRGKVYGSKWTAFPINSEMTLLEGEKVEVVRVHGLRFTFKNRKTQNLPISGRKVVTN